MLRPLTALFENTVGASLAGERFSGPIERQTGVPEGFVLTLLLFALSFSPVIDALRETGLNRSGGLYRWGLGGRLFTHG